MDYNLIIEPTSKIKLTIGDNTIIKRAEIIPLSSQKLRIRATYKNGQTSRDCIRKRVVIPINDLSAKVRIKSGDQIKSSEIKLARPPRGISAVMA